MIIVSISVWFQAVASLMFLIRYTMLIKWWKTVSGNMLAGMVTCLLLITSTLAITETNEGLGDTPPSVLIGRFGFALVMLFGLVGLEVRYRRRKRKRQRGEEVPPVDIEVRRLPGKHLT